MKKLFTLALLFSSMYSFAQISILNADMPRVNDTMRYSTASVGITAAQAALTGSDTIWDFTNLVPTGQDVEKFYAPSATPYIIQFGLLSGATYGIKDDALNNLASLGSLSGINIENVYGFYKNSNKASVMLGRGISVSGIPLAINLNPRDTVYKFPLNFGDVDTSYFSGSATIPNLGGISQQGRRVNKVDGWGTVKTPFGEFACIRVKTDITETDTIQVQTFKIPIPNNRTIFTWWAKGVNYPVLEVTQTLGLAGTIAIKYRDIYRAEIFASAARFNANRTAARTIDTINLISTSTGTPKSYLWTITPNNVAFVAGTNASTRNPRVLFTQAGVYTVKLKVVYEGGEDDTTRTNYITISEAPTVDFTASKLTPFVGEEVAFTLSASGSPTSYRWSFTPNTVTYQGGTSATSKDPKVTFNNKAIYAVSVTVNYQSGPVTVNKKDFVSSMTESINKATDLNKAMKVYPNPAKSTLYIQSDVSLHEAKIDLIDVLGKQANVALDWQGNNKVSMDVSDLAKGIYFLRIQNSGQANYTKRVVVE